ncbi:hypothetical protein AB0L99_08815 [Streptomyces sp. NPDC051954]|uniref:hypothetical protein n=1 Tax=Streptomyces sp. NPDC051954 TaxID=3155524 RepID=UPI00341F83AB
MRLRYDRTSVAHWLKGSLPRPFAQRLIADAFSRRLGRCIAHDELGFLPHPASAIAVPGTPQGSVATIRALSALCGEAMRQRPLSQPHRGGGVPAPSWPGSPTAGHRPVDAAPSEPHELAPVRTVLLHAARSFEMFGGRHGRTALSTYAVHDVVPLLPLRGSARHRRTQTLTEVARLCFMLARLHMDSELHVLAKSFFACAQEFAVTAEDQVTWALAVHGASVQALHLRHTDFALRAAHTAVDVGVRAAGLSVQAVLLAQLTVPQAATGQHDEARSTLHAAELACDVGADGCAEGPFAPYPAAALASDTAEVLYAAGDMRAAASALRDSLRLRAPHDHRGQALDHARLGQMLLRQRRLEEAAAEARLFTELHRRLSSGFADTAYDRLFGEFRTYGGRSVAIRTVLDLTMIRVRACGRACGCQDRAERAVPINGELKGVAGSASYCVRS